MNCLCRYYVYQILVDKCGFDKPLLAWTALEIIPASTCHSLFSHLQKRKRKNYKFFKNFFNNIIIIQINWYFKYQNMKWLSHDFPQNFYFHFQLSSEICNCHLSH
jgi:hypothetical protein